MGATKFFMSCMIMTLTSAVLVSSLMSPNDTKLEWDTNFGKGLIATLAIFNTGAWEVSANAPGQTLAVGTGQVASPPTPASNTYPQTVSASGKTDAAGQTETLESTPKVDLSAMQTAEADSQPGEVADAILKRRHILTFLGQRARFG